MVAKGRHKAQEAPVSPARKTNKRKQADVDGSQSGSEDEEDVGRGQSEDLMKIIRVTEPKDDGWTQRTLAQLAAQETELNAALDEKEQELNTLDRDFRSGLRSLLTDVLDAPSDEPPPSHRKGITTHRLTRLDPRPGFDHAQALLAKSERLVRSFAIASQAVENATLYTDQAARFEKDQADVAELLSSGCEISRRQIEHILRRPEEDTPREKRKKEKKKRERRSESFDEDKLDEAAAIFDALREKGGQDAGKEEDEKKDGLMIDVIAGPGLYPVLRDAKRGLGRLAGAITADHD